MIKISDKVQVHVLASPTIIDALQQGTLNLSAYAKRIHPIITEQCKKPVQLGAIKAALTRLQQTLKAQPSIYHPIVITEIFIQTNLVELVFAKNTKTLNELQKVISNIQTTSGYVTLTHGLDEISVITTKKYQKQFKNSIKALSNLVGIIMKVDDAYTTTPNIFFSLLAPFAAQRINVIELNTTSNEIILLLHQTKLDAAMTILSPMME